MTTYDPHEPAYLDEKSVRDELTRAFDICGGCRRCVEHCSVFPTLFDLLDGFDGAGAGLMTPAEQDQILDRCFQCKVCAVDCPFTPGRHELALDVPRLMLRTNAMRRSAGQLPVRRRHTTKILGRTNLFATLPFASWVSRARPGARLRRVVQWSTGISASRVLPSPADGSFRGWFERRDRRIPSDEGRRVTLVPTCLVEHDAPQIGADLVRVLERNGVDCATSGVTCCGAPWLYGGDLARFTDVAERNVRTLAAEVRDRGDVMVLQPTCGHVLQRDYVDHVRPSMRSDAELVARHTFDATQYLMDLRSSDGLDTEFDGPAPASITHQVGGHLRVRGIGHMGSELLRLTGAHVTTVEQDSADEVMWGFRTENVEAAVRVARRLASRIGQAGGEIVTGDSVLTNTTIEEQTERRPVHPVEVIARAYGLPPEP